MSAAPTEPNSHLGANVFPGGATGTDSDRQNGIDPQLIQRTKNEIRGLVQEISQLAQSEIPPDRFYEEFLRRVVQALASHGGAFWSVGETSQLKLEYQINMPTADLVDAPEPRKRHALLLRNVLASGQPTLVPPRSGSSDKAEAANPTDFLLILATVGVDQETRGIVEIFQRAGGGPTTQRGYLRFLVQMSDLVGDYLKSRRLRHLGNRQTLWENLEQFLESIHRSLGVRATAYTIVNESRRLIGCDRVSLSVRRGRRQQVIAVSSLDTLDRRADQIKRLGHLATVVTRACRPVWYGGGSGELPPQIAEPLQAYIDRSHGTLLAILPLFRPGGDTAERAKSESEGPVGALIVEQLEDSQFHKGFRERVETVARHGGAALANSLEHESVFLLPVWRALGRARWIARARNLPKILVVIALLLVAGIGLAVVPADFEISARGKLQPAIRREVFAHIDGVVVDVPVRDERLVRADEVLVRLTNNSLEVEIANTIGRKRATRQRIRSIKRSQLDSRLRLEEQDRLNGELLELQQIERSLDRELALQMHRREQLVVRSPMDGEVVTWNVRESLQGRPVRIGQSLMTVVDRSGDWELEIYMPERRMGHLMRAAKEQDRELKATYVLASHPEREFTGRVTEIDRIAEVHSDEGNAVRLKVTVDKEALPELRGGTTVISRVHCGRRAVGYVLFHELVETVRKNMLLWL